MEALGKDARRLLELAKGSHEPPALAKTCMRERLDAKLAATAILGATGLASKATLASVVLPASKTLFVSLVLVGAASVGYVTAPALRSHSTTAPLPRIAVSVPVTLERARQASATDPGTERVSAAASSAVLARLGEAPVAEFLHEPTVAVRESSQQVASSASRERVGEHGVTPLTSESDERAPDPATVLAPEPDEYVQKSAASDARVASQLTDETRLIRQAHQAILKGEPSIALDLLTEHQRRFPSGVLRQERDAARIVANCRLGRTQEARLQWSKYKTVWPSSPLVERVRSSCHWENAR